jgi:hypothetical protein
MLAPFGAWFAPNSARAGFWRQLAFIGFGYGVGTVSLFVISTGFGDWSRTDPQGNVDAALVASAAMLGLAGAALWMADRSVLEKASAAALGMLALSILAADRLAGHSLMVGLLFMALWAGLAGAALHAQARWAFQIAVGCVALRLIILAFEEAGGLLASGLGLILGGVLILGVAWGAMRVSRRFAPMQEQG